MINATAAAAKTLPAQLARIRRRLRLNQHQVDEARKVASQASARKTMLPCLPPPLSSGGDASEDGKAQFSALLSS